MSFSVRPRGLGKRLSDQTGDFNMLLYLALFLLWLVLNILDITISSMATQAGAIEVGLLYQLGGTYLTASINKIMLAILTGLLLVYFRKSSWLALLNLGMLGLCVYNGVVLLELLP